MSILRKAADRLLGSLVPRTPAEAACEPAGPVRCGTCSYGHEKYCCQHYDSCRPKCWWQQYPNGC